ncbi:hypothetical protein L798_13204 [Zootermopsis nevadensis]|uniref:Uncharacterized protein n=1 Tax=Zootermopsis nevadensis TaxID=136037 RepID=A0A067QSY4_ZOONE|nr:hypothetical protein L798_13204 [Zootermopsis nevadensis]
MLVFAFPNFAVELLFNYAADAPSSYCLVAVPAELSLNLSLRGGDPFVFRAPALCIPTFRVSVPSPRSELYVYAFTFWEVCGQNERVSPFLRGHSVCAKLLSSSDNTCHPLASELPVFRDVRASGRKSLLVPNRAPRCAWFVAVGKISESRVFCQDYIQPRRWGRACFPRLWHTSKMLRCATYHKARVLLYVAMKTTSPTKKVYVSMETM